MKQFPVEVLQLNGKTLFRFPAGNGFLEGDFFLEKIGDTARFVPVKDPWHLLFESMGKASSDFMKDRQQGEHEMRI